MKTITHILFAILVIALVVLAFASSPAAAAPRGPAATAPRGPAAPLAGCPVGTYGTFYNGWRVIVTDTTLGHTLLDTTGPVWSGFQTEWDGLGNNNSTDLYSVQAWAYTTNPAVPGVWLIDTSGLHC